MPSKRHLAARALRMSRVGPVALRHRRWRGVLVLTYHRILPEAPPRYAGVWSATPEGFAEQMDLVVGSCDVVALDDVPLLHDAPGRHVAITFDDGYRDNHEWALPVLRDRGIPATVFVTSGIVDGTHLPWWDELAWLHGGLRPGGVARYGSIDDLVREYWASTGDRTGALMDEVAAASDRHRLTPDDVRDEWMTWGMVRELRAGGLEIGAHTVSHPLLSRLGAAEQLAEIAGSADRIAEETGRRPTAVAYPVGARDAFDARSKSAARDAGLTSGYGLYGGPTTASAPTWDPMDIRRIGIGIGYGGVDIAALLALPRVFGDAAPAVQEEDRSAGPQPADDGPTLVGPDAAAGPLEAPAPTATSGGGGTLDPLPGLAPERRRSTGRRGRDERIWTVTLVDRLIHGGAERMAYLLTRDLDRDRFARVMAVTTAEDPRHAAAGTEPAAWREELQDAGVRLVELPRARRSQAGGWTPLVRELRRADVLHSHMFLPNVQAALFGPSTGVPVTIAHEHAWSHTGGPHQGTIERRFVSRRVDAMLACSTAVRDRMVDGDGVSAERVVVLPNGIEGRAPTPGRDLRAELGIAPGTPVVGSVGALRDIKRFDVLIEAVARVRTSRPDVRLLIAGDGDERGALEAQIAALGLGETVTLLGARSDVPDVIAAFDVAVTSSDAEASPLSVMEYMDAGRAIVATDVGGVPEIIEDGVHGRLVPRRDPDAMAAAILELVEDPDERLRVGEAARARRQAEFGLDVMVGRLESLYERMYARAGGRAGR